MTCHYFQCKRGLVLIFFYFSLIPNPIILKRYRLDNEGTGTKTISMKMLAP